MKREYMLDDVIAAISTPIGTGGIGIVRMSGAGCIALADSIFIGKKKLTEKATHTLSYGKITDGAGGEIIDEVLVSVMKAPHTYTKEDIVEINCHGGSLVTRRVLEAVLKTGARIAQPGEFIGGIMKSGGGFAQARLKPVGMDPATITVMAMAGIIVEINQKLDDIQKTQQEILSFLQEKERADSQASLNMLEDILKRYPYNWNNDNFRRNFHVKALDIKHDADAKLILYQKQIAEKIKGLPAVYLDAAVQDAMKQLQKLFHDYRMALYLFSFASYLEVMLDGRFVAEDLKIIADKVHDYQENYVRQFEQCRDYVKKFSGGSVEMMVAGGIANAAKGLGKLIGSAPILKDGPVDEWLQNCGEQIEKANEEKVAKLAESFAAEQKTGSEIFESSIRNVDELSNQVKGMLFDEEYLYLVA